MEITFSSTKMAQSKKLEKILTDMLMEYGKSSGLMEHLQQESIL